MLSTGHVNGREWVREGDGELHEDAFDKSGRPGSFQLPATKEPVKHNDSVHVHVPESVSNTGLYAQRTGTSVSHVIGHVVQGLHYKRKGTLDTLIQERTQEELDLFAACTAGESEEVLRILSKDRSKINARDLEGRTPLITATEANHSLIVLLLLRLGAKVGAGDQQQQTALSHAVVRHNGTAVLALLSALCGLSGSTEHQVNAFLTRRESSLMYALLGDLTSIQIGRATALLALVNPEVVIVTLIRASTATRDKALLIEGRSPFRAAQLMAGSRRFDAAIYSLLLNIAQIIVPNYAATANADGKGTALSMRFPEDSMTSMQGQHSSRELVRCLLDGSHAVEVAVRYEYKPFFVLSSVLNYMDDLWGGSLAISMRSAEEREWMQGKGITADDSTPEPADGVFLIGCRVKHLKHGEGNVISRHRSGRLHVEFDDGETHNYQPASAKNKLTLIALDNEIVRDEDEDEGVASLNILFSWPGFILQGLLLWLPLAIYPPLASALRTPRAKWTLPCGGWRALAVDHYLLEVPVLKFYWSVTLDLLLFLSLTFLSHPRFYTIGGWMFWEPTETLKTLVPIHFFWAVGVTVNEWLQFLQYKSQVLAEFKDQLRRTRLRTCGGFISLMGKIASFIPELLHIDDMVDFFDLFGPLLASISLLDTWVKVAGGRFHEDNVHDQLESTMACALVLLGFRMCTPICGSNPRLAGLLLTHVSLALDSAPRDDDADARPARADGQQDGARRDAVGACADGLPTGLHLWHIRTRRRPQNGSAGGQRGQHGRLRVRAPRDRLQARGGQCRRRARRRRAHMDHWVPPATRGDAEAGFRARVLAQELDLAFDVADGCACNTLQLPAPPMPLTPATSCNHSHAIPALQRHTDDQYAYCHDGEDL